MTEAISASETSYNLNIPTMRYSVQHINFITSYPYHATVRCYGNLTGDRFHAYKTCLHTWISNKQLIESKHCTTLGNRQWEGVSDHSREYRSQFVTRNHSNRWGLDAKLPSVCLRPKVITVMSEPLGTVTQRENVEISNMIDTNDWLEFLMMVHIFSWSDKMLSFREIWSLLFHSRQFFTTSTEYVTQKNLK